MQGATPRTPAYFDMVKPTYLENWPVALRALSVGQVDVPLTVEEAGDLGSNVSEWSGCFGEPPLRDISGIVARLEDAVRQFPKGAFVRLGSRSPKDSWLGYREGFRCRNAQKAITLLTDPRSGRPRICSLLSRRTIRLTSSCANGLTSQFGRNSDAS